MFIVILLLILVVAVFVVLTMMVKTKVAKKIADENNQGNSQVKKTSKALSDRLKLNPEVMKVLEIDDNMTALSKCAALFEKNMINKSELEELEEFIKSRI